MRRVALGLALWQPLTAYAGSCTPPVQNEIGVTCQGYIDECPAQAGGQDIMSGPLWPQSVSASISAYNPHPVYSSSSAWVMLDQQNTGAGLFAQVGWSHQDGEGGNELVFIQWTDNSGNVAKTVWRNVPSGTETYAMYREQPDHTFEAIWKEGAYYLPSSVTWGPDTIDARGEVTAYNPSNGNGDHFPGDNTQHVTEGSIQWGDKYGSMHNPSFYWFGANGGYDNTGTGVYTYIQPSGGNNFQMWDHRCS